MPKVTPHPRLRSHVRKSATGKVRVYYFYDRRTDGLPDLPLGTDYAEALEQWRVLHLHAPAARGRVQEAVDQWLRDEVPKYPNAETQRKYTMQARRVAGVLGGMTWDEVDLPVLRQYLAVSKGKVQANRELSVLSIIWSHARMWGMTRAQWPAAGVKNWKNKEAPRAFEVTDELFAAVYGVADPMLRDCMDIATATGMRLTDCRTVRLPVGDVLRLKASKTGKQADIDVSVSQVLPGVLVRRRAVQADHVMLLTMPDGSPVTASNLRGAWDRARKLAAAAHPKLAGQIKAMYLRDMRKRASDLAEDDEGASRLLQHSSVALTNKHYRAKVAQLKPVR